jgi:hypothetical protein
MNNQMPFLLYQTNKKDFLDKQCAICLSALYYPEVNNNFIRCSKLNCGHIFHNDCINQSINSLQYINNNKCPECRSIITQKIDISRSLELTIRADAFNNNNIDEELRQQFVNTSFKLNSYSYHKIVFERWRKEKDM